MRDRKARKGDVLETALLHVDIDHADALDRRKDFAPVPSVVVWSGNGAHAYWRLTISIAPELAERINQQLAKSLGGDNCHNADRILRLPGTLNIPNAQKLKMGRTRTQAHVVAELTDFFRTPPHSTGRISGASAIRPVVYPAPPEAPRSPWFQLRLQKAAR